jgi:hypothetical protein
MEIHLNNFSEVTNNDPEKSQAQYTLLPQGCLAEAAALDPAEEI